MNFQQKGKGLVASLHEVAFKIIVFFFFGGGSFYYILFDSDN